MEAIQKLQKRIHEEINPQVGTPPSSTELVLLTKAYYELEEKTFVYSQGNPLGELMDKMNQRIDIQDARQKRIEKVLVEIGKQIDYLNAVLENPTQTSSAVTNWEAPEEDNGAGRSSIPPYPE